MPSRKLNIHYASLHGTYWAYFGVLGAFSSIYLLDKGYSNWEIGILLAVANTIAIVVQTLLSGVADTGNKKTIFTTIEIITIGNLLLSTALIFQKQRSILLTIVFMLCFALMMANQPFINAVNRRLEETGVRIAFGTCRSIGSLAYAIVCFFLGTVVENSGPSILPLIGDFSLILIIVAVAATFMAYKKAINEKELSAKAALERGIGAEEKALNVQTSAETDDGEIITLGEFIRSNRLFFVMSLGILGLYFANTVPNAYMAQIVSNVGGNSEDVGRIFSVLAVTEIPTLILFDKLYERFSCKVMLRFSAIAYVAWIGVITIANNVGMIYAAQMVHFFSFPLFLPAMVRFIDDNMRAGEAVRGQTLFTVMTTIGNMLASLVGGAVLDLAGARVLLTIGTTAAVIGAIIIFLMVDRVSQRS